MITRYPMMDKSKYTKTLGQEELKKLTLVEQDGRGMKLKNVTDMEINFIIHVITQKMYSSSHQNSVLCEAMDLTYKVMNKNL